MTQHRQNILVTVDTAIFTLQDSQLQVLLVQRATEPFKGAWALPGGVVQEEPDGSLEQTAFRKLAEKTGVTSPYLEQVMTFGGPERDPRGYSVSVLYMALLRSTELVLQGDDRVSDIAWVRVDGERVDRPLAFDHAKLLEAACQRLRSKAQYSSLIAHLLPDEFTLSELREAYSSILGVSLNAAGFRRRVLQAGLVEEVKGAFRHHGRRPAQLYRLHPESNQVYFETNLMWRVGEG